jgi:hypothetical protein
VRNSYRAAELVVPKTPKRVWKRVVSDLSDSYIGMIVLPVYATFFFSFASLLRIISGRITFEFWFLFCTGLVCFLAAVALFFVRHKRVEVER